MSNAITDALGNPLTIRPATPADESFLEALADRLTNFEVPPWRTADEIASADARAMIASVQAGRRDDEVFVAERDGVGVGCLHVTAIADFFGRPHAHVSVIATTSAAEGSGIGRALIAYAERWAGDRDLSLLTLNVFAGNARGRRVYERAGFSAEILKYAKLL